MKLTGLDFLGISNHFNDDFLIIEKLNVEKPISIIYYDGNKKVKL